jgi:hypothetical protein
MTTYDPTCKAHYANDPASCSGPAVVTVMLSTTVGTPGCETHAAALLRANPKAWPIALPHAPAGATKRVFLAGRS